VLVDQAGVRHPTLRTATSINSSDQATFSATFEMPEHNCPAHILVGWYELDVTRNEMTEHRVE
jgi:hypothetical protein